MLRRLRLWLGLTLCDGCDRMVRFTVSDGRSIFCRRCWRAVRKYSPRSGWSI